MLLPSSYVLYVTYDSIGERPPIERQLRSYCLWSELDVVIRALNDSAEVKSILVCVDNSRAVRPLTHADMGYDAEVMLKVR